MDMNILVMAEELGIECIIEGVETQHQVEYFQKKGVSPIFLPPTHSSPNPLLRSCQLSAFSYQLVSNPSPQFPRLFAQQILGKY